MVSPSGWRRRRRDGRRTAAKRLGVDGILAARDAQYAFERAQWAWWNAEAIFRAGRTAKQRRRPETKQHVMFKSYDVRGDEYSWPAYPRDSSGRADHRWAMHYVRTEMLQQLRDVELAA